jgi:hypothetical protein
MAEKEGRPTGGEYRKRQGLVAVVVYVAPEVREAVRDAAYLNGRQSIQEWAAGVLETAAAKALEGRERPSVQPKPRKKGG